VVFIISFLALGSLRFRVRTKEVAVERLNRMRNKLGQSLLIPLSTSTPPRPSSFLLHPMCSSSTCCSFPQLNVNDIAVLLDGMPAASPEGNVLNPLVTQLAGAGQRPAACAVVAAADEKQKCKLVGGRASLTMVENRYESVRSSSAPMNYNHADGGDNNENTDLVRNNENDHVETSVIPSALSDDARQQQHLQQLYRKSEH
jgi:hypothetical protein